LTIDPRLKDMMDRIDGKQPVASVAVDTRASGSAGLPPLGYKGMPGAPSVLPSLATVLEEAEIVGAALQFKVEGIVLNAAAGRQNEDLASRREEAISNQSGREVASAFSGALGTTVNFSSAEQQQRTTTGPRAPAPGTQPGGRRGGRRLGGEDVGGPAEGGGL